MCSIFWIFPVEETVLLEFRAGLNPQFDGDEIKVFKNLYIFGRHDWHWKMIICIILFIPHTWEIALEEISDLHKVTCLVNGRAGISTWVCVTHQHSDQSTTTQSLSTMCWWDHREVLVWICVKWSHLDSSLFPQWIHLATRPTSVCRQKVKP